MYLILKNLVLIVKILICELFCFVYYDKENYLIILRLKCSNH
jgi:hypothetical protein